MHLKGSGIGKSREIKKELRKITALLQKKNPICNQIIPFGSGDAGFFLLIADAIRS